MTTHDPFLDRLDEEFAPGWKPAPGQTVDGLVESIGERTTEYGTYPIVTIQVATGGKLTAERVAVHAMHTVLKNKITEKGIVVGGRVAIRYDGEKKTKDGKGTYHAYSVAFDRIPPAGWQAGVDPDDLV